MHKRLVSTAVLGIALLFSQGANILVAALCPHLRSPAVACMPQTPESADSDEHMDHMEMNSTESEFVSGAPSDSTEVFEGVAFSQPTGPCPHCAMHSRSSSNPASFREIETARRASDLNTPLLVEPVVVEHESAGPSVASRAHGPPGDQLPRHVLINVYRI